MPTARNYTKKFDEVPQWDILNFELNRILNISMNELNYLKGKSILVTGGSGVIGKWILRAIYEANKRYKLGIHIYATTRDEKNLRMVSGIEDNSLKVLEIDLANERAFKESLLSGINIDVLIHSAVSSTDNSNEVPHHHFEPDISMIKNLISLSSNKLSSFKFILLSSGVVIDHSQTPSVNDMSTPYASMKHEIERILLNAKKHKRLDLCIMRIYNIYGPGIPLFSKTAIGNFMAGAFFEHKIIFESHPESQRSFIYIGDLIIQILFSLNYDGGEILFLSSLRSIRFKYLVELISSIFEGIPVEILPSKFPTNQYCAPFSDVLNTKQLLKLPRQVSLLTGLRRWKNYLENVSKVEVASFK